jgi:hypothetical protein
MQSIEDLEPFMLMAAVQQQTKLYMIYGEFKQRPVIRFAQYDSETGKVIFFDDPALGNLLGTSLIPYGDNLMLMYLKNGVKPRTIVISAENLILNTFRFGNWKDFKDTYVPEFATIDKDRLLMTVKELNFTPESSNHYLLLAFNLTQQNIEVIHKRKEPKEPLFWLHGKQSYFEVHPFSGRIDKVTKQFEKINTLKSPDKLIRKEDNRTATLRQSFKDELAAFPFKYHIYFDFPFLIENQYTFRGTQKPDDEIEDFYSTLSLTGDFKEQKEGQLLGVFKDHKIFYDFSKRVFSKVKGK